MNITYRVILIALICLIPWVSQADGSRYNGIQDSSRDRGSTDTQRLKIEEIAPSTERRHKSRGHYRPKPHEEQPRYGYWSEKCLRQRGSSQAPWIHTRDCDNPAYSGAYYPPPYRPGVPVIIINNDRRH